MWKDWEKILREDPVEFLWACVIRGMVLLLIGLLAAGAVTCATQMPPTAPHGRMVMPFN